jgi:uncharacterized Tic20 family protein
MNHESPDGRITGSGSGFEERFWGALVHLSALLLGMGMILPLIAWGSHRRKSKRIAFQSLQALGYQTIGYTVWFLVYLLVVIVLIVVYLPALSNGMTSIQDIQSGNSPIAAAILLVFVAGFGLYMLPPLFGAVACGLGYDFRYPILGGRLAKFVGYAENEELREEASDRFVAAAGHFAVIIPIWGLIPPVYTWTAHAKRSAFAHFQAAQTTVYQVLANLQIVLAGVFYVGVAFTTFSILLDDSSEGPSMTVIVFLLVFLILAALALLAIPCYHILGQWAGLRILRGHDFRYPLIGKLVEKRIWKAK